jgi:ribosomal protein L11 methyltransferase
MKQIEISFTLNKISTSDQELMPFRLEKIGYEGFNESAGLLLAYISSEAFNADTLIELLQEHHLSSDCFTITELPDKNWNEEWERNFQPVVIDNKCYIRAPFHKPDPLFPIEIIIEPKMSFGTGHHATTSLMVKEILEMDMKDRKVLDAGCGTGILAILSEKMGAEDVTAVDIDEWSFINAKENAGMNHCEKIHLILGDAGSVNNTTFDYILANINLNILKSGLKNYESLLRPQGRLIMSGILDTDIPALRSETEKYNLTFEYSKTLSNWAVVSFKKK